MLTVLRGTPYNNRRIDRRLGGRLEGRGYEGVSNKREGIMRRCLGLGGLKSYANLYKLHLYRSTFHSSIIHNFYYLYVALVKLLSVIYTYR